MGTEASPAAENIPPARRLVNLRFQHLHPDRRRCRHPRSDHLHGWHRIPASPSLRSERELGDRDEPVVTRVAPFTSWSAPRWQNVETQADKIRAFVGAPAVTIDRVEQPTDQPPPRNTATGT